jgi:hypothetical protein
VGPDFWTVTEKHVEAKASEVVLRMLAQERLATEESGHKREHMAKQGIVIDILQMVEGAVKTVKGTWESRMRLVGEIPNMANSIPSGCLRSSMESESIATPCCPFVLVSLEEIRLPIYPLRKLWLRMRQLRFRPG